MKKVVLGALFALGLAASAQAEPLKIGIAQFGPHPQLDAVVDAFKAEIAAEGLSDVTYDYGHVNFDPALIPQLVQKIKAGNPDLLLTITTPLSQGAKQVMKDSGIPIVFSAVTDPVAAKLVPSWDKGDADMTGASDLQNMDGVLEFIRKLLPDAKTVGFPYNPGEDNDVVAMQLIKELAPKHGFEVAEVGVDNANDIPIRIASLKGKADVIYVPGSNLIQPAISAVASAADQAGIPIVNSSEDSVVDHRTLASFAVNYSQVGRNAAKLAVAILKDKKSPAELAPIKPTYEDHAAMISAKQLAKYNMTLPKDMEGCGCIAE